MMFDLSKLKAFAKTGDLKEIKIKDVSNCYVFMFSTSSLSNFALSTARGEKREFKTLDAVAKVAQELVEIAAFEAGKDIEVKLDFNV